MSKESDALVEAATALLEGAGGSLFITSLNKALFYLDLHALLTEGATITQATYLALPAGPIVAKYEKRVVRALEEAGIAQQDEAEDGSKPVCLIHSPQPRVLTASQLQLARRLGAWAAKKSASQISDLSHQNPGWKLAYDLGLGAKRPAEKIDLRIAMQQLLDDDPWLRDEPAGEVAEAFREADAANGEEW